MTEVYAGQDGRRFLLHAQGHAGRVDCCNYITGILYAFAGLAHNEGEILAFSVEEEGGAMLIDCRGGERLHGAFDAAVIGLEQLAALHPEAIRIESGAI